jgi:hypothetical protein
VAATDLPPFLFASANPSERRRVAELKRAKRVWSIGPRLYTSLPRDQVADAVRRQWSTIVGALFPGALLTHRTALEFRPDPDGAVIITATTNRELTYPGLSLRFLRGPGPLADDPPFMALRSSSEPRALLENLATLRRGTRPRIVRVEIVEERLERILRARDEAGLNELRDRAREIAHQLGWTVELRRLEALIGALLGTRSTPLASPLARARANSAPYDASCLERLQLLFAELRAPVPDVTEQFESAGHYRHKAFFEAYFSNYIEGTTFEIEEAEAIVFDGKVPAARPKDAHDVTGTFLLVADPSEMRRVPTTAAELLELLRERHRTMLASRPEVSPGELKTRANRAGDTHFVEPALVLGTLGKGAELLHDLAPGIARAIFVMFLVSDVHPFTDGNGRVARIMMNAELVSAGRSTIIIPNVYRDDYLQALRALTRRHRPALIVEALTKAQAFSALDFTSYAPVLKELQRRNWFKEPDEARIVVPVLRGG